MQFLKDMKKKISHKSTNSKNKATSPSNRRQYFANKAFVGNKAAYRLVGTPIHISGTGGWLFAKNKAIKTGYGNFDPSEFIMEYITEENQHEISCPKVTKDNQQLVAFRLKDTNLYLSQNPFGSVAQAETIKNISTLPILPEISREIVEFAVGPENNVSGIGEGEGFDYRSMHLEEGPPGLLEQFALDGTGLRKVGIKSLYGKYWRAPSWSDTVTQSPNQLGDEDFHFHTV